MIRALGYVGYSVVAASTFANCAGGRSKHCKASLTYPDPKVDPAGFSKTILDLVHEHQIDLVIPVTDEAILPLDAIRDQFPPSCQIAMSDSTSLSIAADKQLTVELAQKLEIPTPYGRHVQSIDEATKVADALGYPVVVKPVNSRQNEKDHIKSFRVSYASSRTQLREQFAQIDDSQGVIIQRRVEGAGCGVEVLAENGHIRAAFQHERIREVPLTGGVSSMRVSRKVDPKLLEYTTRLIRALRWNGLAMVEFKVGPDGPWLMEINGRIWGSIPLAISSGMNFPVKLVHLYENRIHPDLDLDYQVGTRCRNFLLDLKWAAKVLRAKRTPWGTRPKRMMALQVLADLIPFRSRWDIWRITDPMPGIVAGWHGLRRMSNKVSSQHRKEA